MAIFDFLSPKSTPQQLPTWQSDHENASHSDTLDADSFPQPPKPTYIPYNPYSHGYPHSNTKTAARSAFRPRTNNKGGLSGVQLRRYAEETLGQGSLRKIVRTPSGEDDNEWIAVNREASLLHP